MAQLKSSFSGSNICFISHGRSLDRGTDCSVNHERFYLHCRTDTQCVVKKLVDKNCLTQEAAEKILSSSRNELRLEDMTVLKEHTNFVPLETVAFMRENNEKRFIDVLPTITEEKVEGVHGVDVEPVVDDSEPETSDHEDEGIWHRNTTSNVRSQFRRPNASDVETFIEKLTFPCAKVSEQNSGAHLPVICVNHITVKV